jgi:hypothetical protein
MKHSYSCEQKCICREISHPTHLIVLTGGPGAGKTAILEYVRKILCEHVAILPEAATILFGGGFWRLDSESARRAEQKAIYHVQNEIQNLVIGEDKWTLGLCDRGTLDSLAFWPSSEDDFFKAIDSSREKEYSKFKAVLHLQSPSAKLGYNHENPVRIETPEQAAMIDQKIHEVWKHHPNYYLIDSAENFLDKLNHTKELIVKFISGCCKDHLRHL